MFMEGPNKLNGLTGGPDPLRRAKGVNLDPAVNSGGASGNSASISGASSPGISEGLKATIGPVLIAMMAQAGQAPIISGNFPNSKAVSQSAGQLSEEIGELDHPVGAQLEALFGDGAGAQEKFRALVAQASRLDEKSLARTGQQLKAEEIHSSLPVDIASPAFMNSMRRLVDEAANRPSTLDIINAFHQG